MVSSRALESLNAAGSYANIHGIVVDGQEPVHDFLASLGDPDLTTFLARFDKLSESGVLTRIPWKHPHVQARRPSQEPHPPARREAAAPGARLHHRRRGRARAPEHEHVGLFEGSRE